MPKKEKGPSSLNEQNPTSNYEPSWGDRVAMRATGTLPDRAGPEDGIHAEDVDLMRNQHGVPNGPLTVSQEDVQDHMSVHPSDQWPKPIMITEHQARALEKVVEMDRTAWISHGGLKGLLGITDSQVLALADIVAALKK